MKNILIVVALCLFTTQGFSQETAAPQITKEIICRGAAVSVMGSVHPFIKTKTKAEVINVLNTDFLKLKEAVVAQGLINSDY